MEFIDTHVHLSAPDYASDLNDVLSRAHAAGVTKFVAIGAGYGAAGLTATLQLAERLSNVWATVGIHPHEAAHDWDVQTLEQMARHPRVVAIGEIGLDFFRELSPREAQERVFREQIALALRVRKPIVIHCRSAGAECLDILQQCGAATVGGVFHCYSEDALFAQELFAMNFSVSFPGNLTFKNATTMREVARTVPLDRILLETDGPYLAPEPHRGKRCESAFLLETAKILAEVRGLAVEEVARATSENAKRLFRLRG